MAKKTARTKAENERLKEHAKLLYTVEGVTLQKELAERVGVSEQTISKWVNEGQWETRRASLTMTKEEELRRLYRRLSFHNDSLERLEEEYNDTSNLIAVTADPKEKKLLKKDLSDLITQINKVSDSISKTSAAIRSMETDTSIGDSMQAFKELIQFIRNEDFDLAKTVTTHADELIKTKLK